ncbi:uncharacterized protein LOC116770461 isoform X2 [Danaus plexippus]|uniref:uncharacterized protein LOC116770461 isoform X2 n=1 Tax=Danaus plexippus TaxID=13037 RepID=UPI002AAF15A4|nr:uncharacterized protein LOC116770461 isoform X2 [Danaus plexippus]
MNDPWDVKSVRQSNQYMSCMKLNGVPLLPPVLSKECYLEMQYYKLLAKEVEKRIQKLKPYVVESDSESSEDRTDAPELPESEQSYDVSPDAIESELNNISTHLSTEKCLADCNIVRVQPVSNTYDNITSNFSMDSESASSKLSSKYVIDLSLSINETGRNIVDSINTSYTPIEIPERDCDYSKKPKATVAEVKEGKCQAADQINFSVSIKDTHIDALNLCQDGPPSLSCKSFTGSLNNIHTESVKEAEIKPLIRQRSYTVLIPSPMLLAHLEVQSINTGMDITSISMSESMSNISNTKKRRSWDLETAKVKWSSMALELKEKNLTNKNKAANPRSVSSKPVSKKVSQATPQRPRSLAQERIKRSPPKATNKSEPAQKPRNSSSPVRNTPLQKPAQLIIPNKVPQKTEVETPNNADTSESDPATRVRELYDKIQKQQLIQMANLVEKQKKEQMLLQQVFEEQNNLLFTQLKTICPKSPIDVKEAWVDHSKEDGSRGPVSLSQLMNQKQPEISHGSPVPSTLIETNNYINYCDSVLKKSRDIKGSIKKAEDKDVGKGPSCQQVQRPRACSPTRRNTPTSRKLTYDNSASSDRDKDQLTDRTNDTMADILNVTFPSDYSDECPPCLQHTATTCSETIATRSTTGSCRSTDKAIRSMEQTIQNSINSMSGRRKTHQWREPTPQERMAATKIVSYAKGYLVRRLMSTERVQATVQTIKDALLCALQLHQEREGIRGADVDLHRRLIQQITAACYSLHDTFITSSSSERCALIAADRSRRRSLAARLPTPTPTPPHRHRHTDVMSQSHSGAFPSRLKRQPPSIMTQSSYETFSCDKSVRRYMPSPRRRPWR